MDTLEIKLGVAIGERLGTELGEPLESRLGTELVVAL